LVILSRRFPSFRAASRRSRALSKNRDRKILGRWQAAEEPLGTAARNSVVFRCLAALHENEAINKELPCSRTGKPSTAPTASVVRHKDCNVSSFLRARLTFSKMSEAVAVQMNGLGFHCEWRRSRNSHPRVHQRSGKLHAKPSFRDVTKEALDHIKPRCAVGVK
jgi:hypothetical protein